jgi:hypothetical protein
MDEMVETIQAEVTEDPPTVEVEAFFVTPTFCKNKNFVQIGVYIKL